MMKLWLREMLKRIEIGADVEESSLSGTYKIEI